MKKRFALIAIGMSAVLMLGGCGSIKDVVTDKLEEMAGKPSDDGAGEISVEKDDIDPSVESPKSDEADSLQLLGDLMGEKYGNADVSFDTDTDTETDTGADNSSSEDRTAPENQTIVKKAEEWQGYYEGTVNVIGYGEGYEGFEAEYVAYGIVRDPDDDYPYMEIYSDDFDVWDNVSFSYEDQALVSMYVMLSDSDLTPVVYKFGDAYVIDESLTDSDVQAFAATSDGRHTAKIEAEYQYTDPELDSEGGLTLQFDLTKYPVY